MRQTGLVDSALIYILIAVAIAVVAVVAVVGLVVRGRKAPPKLGPGGAGGAVDELEPGGGLAPSRGVEPDLKSAPSEAETSVATLERPEAPAGRMQRLRARLAGSNKLGKGLLALLSRGNLDEDTWDEIEEILITSDLGVGPTQELMDRLRSAVKKSGNSDPAAIKAVLRAELITLVDPSMDRALAISRNAILDVPAVVMVVGVNGTGKTTTTGKLARLLVAEDADVLLGAADTFRAAASEQLQTWGQRVGVPVVRGPEGGDPASVAFDAVTAGIEEEVDVVLIDTAGRLHNKVGLMDELGKVKRVIEKKAPLSEVLLVLDATTGQNGLVQARVFAEVVDVTGVVLTKLDGTAKGGIVVAVQRELGVPVKLIGLGEGPDDLAPFDPEAFVDALLS